MQIRSVQPGASAPRGKRKLLAWLVFLSFFIGLAEIGEPLDLGMNAAQFKMRAQSVSGKIVAVGVDDEALMAVGSWPWKRDQVALLTERLIASGADRIFFTIPFPALDKRGDSAFADVIAKHPGRIFLAATMDYRTGETSGTPVLPSSVIAKHATIVSNMKWVEFWNGVSVMPYGQKIGGRYYKSVWTELAKVDNRTTDQFPVDYSYRRSSIPYFSAAKIIGNETGHFNLRGKSVIVGQNSNAFSGFQYILGQGRTADIFVVALGAETLLNGQPISLGWLPAWTLALLMAVFCLSGRWQRFAALVSIGTIAVLFVTPFLLQTTGIFVEVAPALLLAIATATAVAWQRFGARKQSQGAINPVSGLPTVNAILHRDELDPQILIAARISRFTEIVSTLPPEHERELLGQVVSRLALGVGRLQLLHGDDGNFFWLMPSEQLGGAVDQFKALQLIFRNSVAVQDKSFTVDIAFGVDQEIDRPLSHRLASALAAAKAAADQGTCWKIHDPAASGAQQWQLSLLGELDQAIDNGHLWVAYQPKMELASRRIVGAEALARWTHATRGPIGPDEFIQVAERHGRIEKLTAFVLNDAARVGAEAMKQDSAFSIAVNISSALLASRNIIDMVRQALAANNFPAANLVLEVTETAAMAEGRVAIALLEELRDMGVRLSIDDYGTGMSTLEYLRSIPATELKIDKQFSMALQTSAEDQAVMQSTIELAHALGMQVVAEGIETAETLYLLEQMGCEIGQGYHICRPTDWETILGMIPAPARIVANG